MKKQEANVCWKDQLITVESCDVPTSGPSPSASPPPTRSVQPAVSLGFGGFSFWARGMEPRGSI